ncbi:hypothetical protein GCM10028807_32780 [Spirosoma daeguense]
MKYYIYVSFFFFISIIQVFAQAKIEGIGKFKIGVTNLSVIEDLSNELRVKPKVLTTYSEYFQAERGKSGIYILQDDGKSVSTLPHSSLCDGVEVYYINKYTISEIELENIFLTFNDGVLVEFACDSSRELTEAIELKYGKGELEAKAKKVSCLYNYTGAKVELEETTYTTTWQNKSIKAVSLLMAYYDRNCKKSFINSFDISLPLDMRYIHECNDEKKSKKQQSDEVEKKKKLKDF